MRRLATIAFIYFVFFFSAFGSCSIEGIVENILRDLYFATGNFQVDKPSIEIVGSEQKIASFSYRRNLIIIEQKAIEVCRTFGKDSLNALAFIIGHELAHAYKGKEKGHKNYTSFLAYDRHFKASIREEKVADIQGAFNAYLAGYNTSGIISKLIEELYKSYDLIGKKLYGYPTLEERKRTSHEVENIVDTLIQVFESANYLIALGHYQPATKYYEYIMQYYRGREILNNLGILNIHKAMQVAGKNVDPYVLPIELDFQSRLDKTRSEKLTVKERMIRKALLEKALSYFNQVLQYEKRYFPAQLNKLCIMILNENYEEALTFYASHNFQKAIKSKKEKAKARLAISIAYAFLGEKNQPYFRKSGKILNELSSSPDQLLSQLASYNLSVQQNNFVVFPKTNSCNLSYTLNEKTSVDEVTPYRFINRIGTFLDKDKQASFYKEQLPNSNVLVANWEGQAFILQRITNPKIKTKGGLKIGLHSKVLFEKLEGSSFSIIPAHNGYFVYCSACNLIFKMNKLDLIIEWGKIF